MTRFEMEDCIAEREQELDDAVYELMSVLLMDNDRLTMVDGRVLNDIKEEVCRYVAKRHCFKLFRPVVIVDEYGDYIFEEYPYENDIL